MTKINYHRKNKKPVNQRHPQHCYHNGYGGQSKTGNEEEQTRLLQEEGVHLIGVTGGGGSQRVGKTDFLDKSLHSWGRTAAIADVNVGAGIGNDFTNGRRGMARAVRGAKKFVRTRIRFHENAATKKLNTTEDD